MVTSPPIQVPPVLIATNKDVGPGVLSSYVGKPVEDFCAKYNDHNLNHCAHFVSHVLKLRLPHAALCSNVGANIVYADRNKGYCIRVDQIFNSCGNRSYWDDKMQDDTCFVIATIKSVIDSEDPLTLNTGETKHIGILAGGKVYNYSNSHDQVAAKSIEDFKNHYGKNTILLRADLLI
jgi:hypothetical protein